MSYLKNLKKEIFIDCYDPRVDQEELKKEYNVLMKKPKGKYNCIIVAVAHKEFLKMKKKIYYLQLTLKHI